MKEIKWNDESVERYHAAVGFNRYYGKIKNSDSPVYINDKNVYIDIKDEIVESLNKIQNSIKEYEEKGYEYFEYDIRTDADDNGGKDNIDITLIFFRKETEEEKQKRLEDIKKEFLNRLNRLEEEALDVRGKILKMKEKFNL